MAINKLNFTFACGETLSDTKLNKLITAINSTIDLISTIDDELSSLRDCCEGDPDTPTPVPQGLDGVSTLLAFTGAVDDAAAQTKWISIKNSTNYPPSGFSVSSNVNLGENEALYMTSALRKGADDWLRVDGFIWSQPVRIGSGNSTSTTGTDDSSYNYIYCRTKENPTAAIDSTNKNVFVEIMNLIEADTTKLYGWNINKLRGTNGLENYWCDHPYGVDETLAKEWEVGFKKNDLGNWEYYYGPICTSHWGHNGKDGDGLEYIFYQWTKGTPVPTLGPTYNGRIGKTSLLYTGVAVDSEIYQLDDFIPDGWTDDHLELTENKPIEYVSTRKRKGTLEGTSAWGAFSLPKVWLEKADVGSAGPFKSRVFCRSNIITEQTVNLYTPTGGDYNHPWPGGAEGASGQPGGIKWYDGIPSGDGTIWSSVCTFYSDNSSSGWSSPSRESDSADYDVEFNPSTSAISPSPPSGNIPFLDHSREGWYDPALHASSLPSGITWQSMVWRAERKVKNGLYDGAWVVTRIKGEKGDPGSGQGTEGYIIHVENDTAIFDDLTTTDYGLEQAATSIITVEKGSADVTSECTYTVTAINLPKNNLLYNLLNILSKYSGGSWILRNVNSGAKGANIFRLTRNSYTGNTLTPGSYYYKVTVTSDDGVLNKDVRIGIYIDKDISGDGSFYKLALIDDYVNFDSSGGNPTGVVKAVVRKINVFPEGSVETISDNNITVLSYVPSSNSGLCLVTDIPITSDSGITSDGESCKVFTFTGKTVHYSTDRYSVTLYKGTQLLDGPEYIECTKALSNDLGGGTVGPQGPGGISITINPDPTAVSFGVDSSTNLWTGSALITCTATKTINGGTTTTISTNGTIDGRRLYYNYTYIDTNNNQLRTSLYYYKYEGTITISAEATTIGNFANQLITQINFYLSENTLSTVSTLTNPLSVTASVPILRSGKKGESGLNSTGLIGKFYYYAGDWDTEVTNLEATSTKYPYVKCNEQFYMYIGGELSDRNKIDFLSNSNLDPSTDTTNWELIQYNKYLISDAIFSKYAHLGALIVNLDWMISLYGEIAGITSTLYSLFDPIAFMTYLYPNDDGASIGVITRSTGTNSLMFKLNAHAKISVKWSYRSTKLVRIHDDVAYRADNSGSLESTDYDVVTELEYGENNNGNRTGSNAIDTSYWNPISGYYCFIGGSVNYIKVKYISNTSNIFIPNYALDLRGGFVYLNDSYIKGEIRASKYYQASQVIDVEDGNTAYVNEGVLIVILRSLYSSSTFSTSTNKLNLPSSPGMVVDIYFPSKSNSIPCLILTSMVDVITNLYISVILLKGQKVKLYCDDSGQWIALEGWNSLFNAVLTDKLLVDRVNLNLKSMLTDTTIIPYVSPIKGDIIFAPGCEQFNGNVYLSNDLTNSSLKYTYTFAQRRPRIFVCISEGSGGIWKEFDCIGQN